VHAAQESGGGVVDVEGEGRRVAGHGAGRAEVGQVEEAEERVRDVEGGAPLALPGGGAEGEQGLAAPVDEVEDGERRGARAVGALAGVGEDGLDRDPSLAAAQLVAGDEAEVAARVGVDERLAGRVEAPGEVPCRLDDEPRGGLLDDADRVVDDLEPLAEPRHLGEGVPVIGAAE
jgi:hypothetical protein